MLDYLRNLRKSDEEKRHETLTAYLDNALTPTQRQQVERDLAQDEELLAEVEQMRLVQQAMRQLPQRRIRRNFTLDPALYGRPRREPLVQAYPVLRTATVMAAFFFIFLLAVNIYMGGIGGMVGGAEPVAMEAASREEVVTETVVESTAEAPLMMEVAPAEEEAEARVVTEVEEVAPEYVAPADEAESTFEELDRESEEAVTMDQGPVGETTEAESAGEEMALIPMPTMTAEEAEDAAVVEEAAEEVVLATVAPEPAQIAGTRSPADGAEPGDLEAPAPALELEAQREEEMRPLIDLEWLTLIFGLILVSLLILTLLARRRLWSR